jgi:hypothetical protein
MFYICTAYFACEGCNRPLICTAQSPMAKTESDWDTFLFNPTCSTCEWKAVNRPGDKAVHKCVTEWNLEIQSVGKAS